MPAFLFRCDAARNCIGLAVLAWLPPRQDHASRVFGILGRGRSLSRSPRSRRRTAIQGVGSAALQPAEAAHSRLPPFRRERDFSRKTQREHDKRVAPIGLDEENVAAFEPRIEPRESIGAGLSFDDKVAAEERDS